ncbi:allantoin catabolism protein [Coriobacterium glomerans PW2]|uniref:Allantoin catabolism protein n=1 Tax=Coriobacterium glomerans (strain ATCC 49209 / DSM 20642 / JCM 10262 / PW2) TaxID=700015 RepID=F2N963_CORGP|nr:(S)-ureidoglycine aminohydrolase [Coriobacterium glomerans]AEB07739.1 allantoin catabolism protein [Coriobacterium glomerans PW2]
MGYINNVTGYRGDILENRSIIRKNNFALIEPDGLVKNVIPGFEDCDITILGSPKLGATFVDYVITINEHGKNQQGWGAAGIESILYLFDGELEVENEDETATITAGGYIYTRPGGVLRFMNSSGNVAHGFMYKRRYQAIQGAEPHSVVGNVNDIDWTAYEGMEDVLVKDLLPSATDMGFDMNIHILSFKPGAYHGYVETHYQEHGAFIYSGEGMYNLDNEWMPVKKGDYIFMASYCLQAGYGVGRSDDFAYIYSKDCNRDVEL